MITPFEQSFKKLLQQVAKERNQMPEEVWQTVIGERFLVRLCLSPYHSHFILKGGSLLAKYINIGRETMDIDFAVQRISSEVAKLQEIFNQITSINVEDGFIFSHPIVSALDHFHMQYPGAQVRIEVHFGKSRFAFFIDLGFGDKVTAQEEEIMLLSSSKGPLFEKSVTISCYPIEFVFAEKLETAIAMQEALRIRYNNIEEFSGKKPSQQDKIDEYLMNRKYLNECARLGSHRNGRASSGFYG